MPTITPEQLLTSAYQLIVQNGSARNSGPDAAMQISGTQALALYADIQVSTALNNTLRVDELLNKAQNVYGIQ